MATSYAAAAVLRPRLPLSPLLPRRRSVASIPSLLPLASSFHLNVVSEILVHESNLVAASPRCASLRVRASSSEETSVAADELVADLKGKWEALENKTTVIAYGGGAIVALWLSAVIIGAINSVPLLPKILELVGIGYTGWFIYRYLLFKQNRKQLATDIEALKKKIAGTGE